MRGAFSKGAQHVTPSFAGDFGQAGQHAETRHGLYFGDGAERRYHALTGHEQGARSDKSEDHSHRDGLHPPGPIVDSGATAADKDVAVRLDHLALDGRFLEPGEEVLIDGPGDLDLAPGLVDLPFGRSKRVGLFQKGKFIGGQRVAAGHDGPAVGPGGEGCELIFDQREGAARFRQGRVETDQIVGGQGVLRVGKVVQVCFCFGKGVLELCHAA